MYTKKDFGKELAEELNKNFDFNRLSTWAHEKYLDHSRELDKETKEAVMTIVFLSEEGFEMTNEELINLAINLQHDD